MVTQFLNNVYKLLLDIFLSSSHLLGEILNRPLLTSHSKCLAKQQILFVVQLGYVHVFIIYVASGMSLQRVV